MGGTGRRTASSLAEVLQNEPYAFDFFQAVRLMLRLRPDRSPIGLASRPEKEVVRVHSRLTLEFPASAIHDLQPHPENGQPPDLTVAFMGLTGTQGVLPQFYTEWMLLRETHKDSAMAAFFDLFNHPNFGPPGNVVGSPTFSQITRTRLPTGEAGSSRQIQLAGKLSF